MGGIRRRGKNNKPRRDRPTPVYDESGQRIDDRNTEEGKNRGYKDIVRENTGFVDYYRTQNICPQEEFDAMIQSLQQDLPASFRITGFRSQTKPLLKIMEGDYFQEFTELEKKGGKVVVPTCLEWYPDRMAYQLNVTRKDIRRDEIYFRLHNFLVAETETGNTSRQETVSMIPPLVLDVKPHHKILDMCAAPGSKTAQLIEALHQDEGGLPTGFLVANDADNARCYMLTHQAKRLQSPCVLITNHDAAIMPNMMVKKSSQDPELVPLKFDRILCDVPCTGDGTMRKNPDIWPKWNVMNGPNLHGLQYRILKRGIELLEVGGRLVYSTCSFNPIENEAVIHRLLKEGEGSLELLDVESFLPGLKYSPGLSNWILADKQGNSYTSMEDVPESLVTIIRPQMFPPAPEEAAKYNLNKCIRILPHQQNTGGFFVALIGKKALGGWEKKEKKNWEYKKGAGKNGNIEVNGAEDEGKNGKEEEGKAGEGKENEKEEEKGHNKHYREKDGGGPPKKKGRYQGFREDPFTYLQENDPLFATIKSYYGLDLDSECFLRRSKDDSKKVCNLYFTTLQVKDIVENNKEKVKLINTGVKAFTRCENKGADCDFRIAQEGAVMTLNFIKDRRLFPSRPDMEKLLQSSDFDKPPENQDMSPEFRKQLGACSTGSVALVFIDKDKDGEEYRVEIIGWKGKSTIRAYVPKNERVHYLRLVGVDVSRFEKNKFQDKKKRKGGEDGGDGGEEGGEDGGEEEMEKEQENENKEEEESVVS